MANVDDGGPAFPHSKQLTDYVFSPGMTLRDYFAGQALAGLMASYAQPDAKLPTDARTQHMLARDTYAIADAMLTIREEG